MRVLAEVLILNLILCQQLAERKTPKTQSGQGFRPFLGVENKKPPGPNRWFQWN